MKRIAPVLFFLTCLCQLNVAITQSVTSKGKLFIIGGGDKPPEMITRIIDESGLIQGGYGVILPMSSADQDSSIYYAKKPFTEAGIQNIFGIRCSNEEAKSTVKADSIRHAKLIYISGGDQSRFMDIVSESEVEKAIHDAYLQGAMVAGTSAGAAVMSRIMITGNQLNYPEYSATFKTIEQGNLETRQGLGLLSNAIVDQHFLIRSRHNRLISSILEFPTMTGIGIDESTAILVSGNQAEVIGLSQVCVYTNPRKTGKILNGKYGAKGLRIDIYLPGDSFRLKK